MDIQLLQEKALKIRRNIITMIGPEQRGHFGGSLSCADIVAVLYFHEMNIKPNDPSYYYRDRFLFSKGHSVLAQYAALTEAGFFSKETLYTLKNLGSILQGHPELITPGIEAVTGSLGQGLSIACGMAASFKLDKLPNRVYVILGDGEHAEGQIWEAIQTAVNFKLDNLCAIIDLNGLQATGTCESIFPLGNLKQKYEAFGWNSIEINGHDILDICKAFEQAKECKERPTVIIAHTVKGKGIPFIENVPAFHNGAMTNQQYTDALNIIDNQLKEVTT